MRFARRHLLVFAAIAIGISTTTAGLAEGPDVAGAELVGAAEQLAEAGLRAAVKYVPSNEPSGQVIGQSRPAGSELQRGEAVSLNVSTGPSPAVIVTVPDATEKTEADGRATLEQLGFEVQTISQSPPAADRVPRGSLVLLYAGG